MIFGADGKPMEPTAEAGGEPEQVVKAIGLVVHYFQLEEGKPKVYAAMVTDMNSHGEADLTVFMPGQHGHVFKAPHQKGDTMRDGHWSWPVRK